MPTNPDMEKALELAAAEGQAEALNNLFERFPASNANFWAVVDFNRRSSEERFFIYDLRSQLRRKFLVAHGKKSGDAFATKFSNVVGSNCSSLGIYKTLDTYQGKHGRSLHIKGLDETNSNALERAVVIHKADYVVPNFRGTERAGRSDGCLAVNPRDIQEVIDSLKGGSYINVWRFQ